MDQLRIRVFGSLVIHRGDALLPPFPTRRSEGLFGYLVLGRERLVHRDVLCGEFWGDQTEAEARKALRTALWRIRSVLEPVEEERGTLLRVEGDQVGFVGSGRVWVDVWELEECERLCEGRGRNLDEPDARRLGQAAQLYRGDFLEGHYDDWCAVHRERLRMTFLTALERLLDHDRARGRWLDAISWGRKLLRYDPLREHVHRALMACHLAMGDRPSALRQYQALVRVLREELDIGPMEETRRLHERIRVTDSATRLDRWDHRPADFPAVGGAEGLAAEVDGALEQLYALTARLERTRSALGAREEVGRLRERALPSA